MYFKTGGPNLSKNTYDYPLSPSSLLILNFCECINSLSVAKNHKSRTPDSYHCAKAAVKPHSNHIIFLASEVSIVKTSSMLLSQRERLKASLHYLWSVFGSELRDHPVMG